ncbi:MAG: alpha/beta hydrolase [Planctomycetota bacterium]
MDNRWFGSVLSSCLIVAALCLGGCYIHFDADGNRLLLPPAVIAAQAWPSVDSAALDEVAYASEDSPEFDASSLVRFKAVLGAGEANTPTHSRGRVFRTPGTLVRVRVTPEGLPSEQWYGFEGLFSAVKPNAFVLTSGSFGSGYELFEALGSGIPAGMRGGCVPEVVAERARFTSGLSVRLPTKMPEKPRGVLVHLAALFGNEYEAEVMSEMSRRGWMVIDVDTRTSVGPTIQEESVQRALALKRASDALGKQIPAIASFKSYEAWAKAVEANPAAQERALVQTNLSKLLRPACDIATQGGVDRAGRTLAEQIDGVLGENALVVEGALDVLGRLYPQTRTMPVAIIGFSAGALSTPTVAARIRGRVAAAVLIGGAANVATAAMNSTLTSGGVRVTCDGKKLTEEQVRELGEAYLKYSKLDPYHTAPTLMGVPVLQVHATWDRWVPAEGGRLLHERLGHPEMLEMPGGHGMLFYFLPWKKEWIADWLERNVPRTERAPSERERVGSPASTSPERERVGGLTRTQEPTLPTR